MREETKMTTKQDFERVIEALNVLPDVNDEIDMLEAQRFMCLYYKTLHTALTSAINNADERGN